jgi:electron transfer flavoprotein alpha subunit
VGAAAAGARVDPLDAAAVADAIVKESQANGYGLVILPHDGAGPAIAARVAAGIGGALLAGASDLTLDEAGGMRATRLRYGGIVKTTSRAGAGKTVVTLVPRGGAPFAAQLLNAGAPGQRTDYAPSPPEPLARRIVATSSELLPEAHEAARGVARALGAQLVDASSLRGKSIAPELYVAIGVNGSTEHNAAVSGAGTIVAIVDQQSAPIAQIADYLLVGDVSEHAKALLSAL